MADAHQKHHDYHIIDPSPWPLVGSIGALVMALGGIGWMQGMRGAESLLGLPITNPVLFLVGFAIVLYTMIGWWGATIKEAHEGHHTRVVGLHLRYGMIMFIASEVMFFVAWFWAFFDASLFPDEAHRLPAPPSPVGSGRRPASRCSIRCTCRSTTPSSCFCPEPP
jgi:cytochrome c oxidase subunit 3